MIPSRCCRAAVAMMPIHWPCQLDMRRVELPQQLEGTRSCQSTFSDLKNVIIMTEQPRHIIFKSEYLTRILLIKFLLHSFLSSYCSSSNIQRIKVKLPEFLFPLSFFFIFPQQKNYSCSNLKGKHLLASTEYQRILHKRSPVDISHPHQLSMNQLPK